MRNSIIIPPRNSEITKVGKQMNKNLRNEKKLVWSDEFNYEGFPDPEKWTFEVQKPGWVNQEAQYYIRNLRNCRVENGKLKIEAHHHSTPLNSQQSSESYKKYTSARIKTQNKGDWLYGRFEIRAKIPKGRGSWPAIWMMPTDSRYGEWPKSGEIDIMEHVGSNPGWIHGSVHCKDFYWKTNTEKTGKTHVPSAMDEFHVYFMNWTEDRIEIGVDELIHLTYRRPDPYNSDNWPFDQKFYLILNIAVGGSWGGREGIDDASFPFRMEVDYVRVYSF